VLLLVFWTELSSNVATAATFMPILAALASVANIPLLQLIAPAAMASSCGFMLPVGTAPNAIVYGSGRVTMREMMRAGLPLDILAAVVVVAVTALTVRWLD
jgi:sodium-dependent dicarboxylate transporter 2/3/5